MKPEQIERIRARVARLKPGAQIPAGNNRAILRDGESRYYGFLHGMPIFTITLGSHRDSASIRLDSYGHLTATTIRAMNEFADIFGADMRASRAGGILGAQWVDPIGATIAREAATGESMALCARLGRNMLSGAGE